MVNEETVASISMEVLENGLVVPVLRESGATTLSSVVVCVKVDVATDEELSTAADVSPGAVGVSDGPEVVVWDAPVISVS